MDEKRNQSRSNYLLKRVLDIKDIKNQTLNEKNLLNERGLLTEIEKDEIKLEKKILNITETIISNDHRIKNEINLDLEKTSNEDLIRK